MSLIPNSMAQKIFQQEQLTIEIDRLNDEVKRLKQENV